MGKDNEVVVLAYFNYIYGGISINYNLYVIKQQRILLISLNVKLTRANGEINWKILD